MNDSNLEFLNDTRNEVRLGNWACSAILVGVVLRAAFFLVATNNGGDALARAAITAKWIQHPNLDLEFGGDNWPPMHFWMMAALSLAVRNVMLACRLLSLLTGSFTLWVLWRLGRELYGPAAALLSLILLALYSLHIGYSTTSSSEAVYLGLLLSALLCFFRYRRSGSLYMLALAGVLLTIDAGIRYESWVFIFLIALLLLFNSGNSGFFSWVHLRGLAVYGVTSGIWPVFWMIHEWTLRGNPLYAISNNYNLIPAQLAANPSHAGLYQLLLPPGVILLTLTPVTVLSCAYGLLLAMREHKALEFLFIAVGFALIQFRSFATGGSLAMARYTLTGGTLLALLAGYGLYRLAQKIRIPYGSAAWLTVALMCLNLALIILLSSWNNRYQDKFRAISPLLQYPRHIEEVGEFLTPRLRSDKAIVIDNYNDESNIITAASGIPLLANPSPFLASQSNPERVWDYMETFKPGYLILARGGILRSYLAIPIACGTVRVRNLDLRCQFRNEIYSIYDISYPATDDSRPKEPLTTKKAR